MQAELSDLHSNLRRTAGVRDTTELSFGTAGLEQGMRLAQKDTTVGRVERASAKLASR